MSNRNASQREELQARLAAVVGEIFRRRCRLLLLERLTFLGAILDSRLRGPRFLASLADLPVSVAVELLRFLEELAGERHPGAQRLYLDLLDERLVRTHLGPETIEEIWRLGRIRGYYRMLESFFCGGPSDPRFETRPTLPPDIRDIPLGTRKSLARSRGIDTLQRLLVDNDVTVIRTLLANPRITEREVVTIAARQPTTPEILAAVAADHRWIVRYEVKKALIFNPATPVGIAVPLLKYLLRPDLRDLDRNASLNCVLRRAVDDLLRR